MDRVCPLLALAADRRTAVDGVDGGHRCHALDPPVALERDRQSRLCLAPAHRRCERYLAFLGRGGSAQPGSVGMADGLRSTRLLLTPEPAWRGMAGRARRSSRGLAVAGAVLAVGATGAAIVAASSLGPDGSAAATPTPRATPHGPTSGPSTEASAEPSATPPATPAPTAVPTATAAPTAAPPTAAPTAAPTPQQTYVVQAGDTLALIAQEFSVPVQALQAANGIADPDEIVIGDVLVIP
jgi:LysM repeat protein